MKRKKQKKCNHLNRIWIDKISDIKTDKLPNGKDLLTIIVDEGRIINGFETPNGKFRSSVISNDPMEDLNYLF